MYKLILKSTNSNDVTYKVRKSLENGKTWVVEVYNGKNTYPQIISGQFKRLKEAREAISSYQHDTTKFPFWGNC